MFASVKSNDLKSLKSYLDSGNAGIGDKINAIQYDYGVTPLVYSADATGDPVKLSPSALTTAMSGGASQTAMAGTMAGTSSIFNEMIDTFSPSSTTWWRAVGHRPPTRPSWSSTATAA